MRVLTQKLTLLPVIVSYLSLLCAATDWALRFCENYDEDTLMRMRHWRKCPRPMYRVRCSLCSIYPDFSDCRVPQFQCVRNSRCIPRTHVCNGLPDCSDGSDEWGCESTPDNTNTNTMSLDSVETTSSFITTASTILQGNEEKTTNLMLFEDNTSSSPTTSTMLPHSESNTAFSSSTSSTIPDYESNTALSSSTSTMNTDIKLNTTPSSSARNTMFSHSEWNTVLPSSSSTAKTMVPDTESNTTSSIPATTRTTLPTSETNTTLATFVANSTILPKSQEKNSSTFNTIVPESSAMQSCPENYCTHNAECIVVQGQYRCRCGSSFIGELCEIPLGTEQGSREYAVVVAISMTLVILCLAAISVYIYRYKRSSSWKSREMTSRTLSQLTLASNAVEYSSLSKPH